MSSPSASSALYRLIEAGQLARRAVLQPLLDKGLEPGDDAVLFVLARSGTSEVDLAGELGVPWDLLEPRLQRLIERGLVGRQAVGPELTPGVALTERGTRIRDSLAEHWAQLEEALLGELKPKRRRKLTDALGRFVELLRF